VVRKPIFHQKGKMVNYFLILARLGGILYCLILVGNRCIYILNCLDWWWCLCFIGMLGN